MILPRKINEKTIFAFFFAFYPTVIRKNKLKTGFEHNNTLNFLNTKFKPQKDLTLATKHIINRHSLTFKSIGRASPQENTRLI